MSDLKPYFGEEALLIHEGSHDTFDEAKFSNWLANGAGLGIYAHGRIHQQVGNTVYVGDLIHKRGYLTTSDLLLMEEQALLSMGEPLSTNSRLGALTALEIVPAMGTANGEGSLIGYYEGGVVSFETQEAPRETRHDGDGNVIQKGWDTKRLVNHMLNVVSAVGRYAVALLPRDNLFRSTRGLHLLKLTTGSESFNSENVNSLSMDVAPLLDADPVDLLKGSAVGFWVFGNRYFATTGLVLVPDVATSPIGRGFVSWNQATTYTEDRTPRPVWEGLWVADHGVVGIHRFVETQVRPGRGTFAFLASSRCRKIYTTSIDHTLRHDMRDGAEIPIEWSFETARFSPASGHSKMSVNDCVIEIVASAASQDFRVLVRTDASGVWSEWKRFQPADKVKGADDLILFTETLGRPPLPCREASWVQLRVEGVGATEVRLIDLDFSETTVKAGRQQSYIVSAAEKDAFEINNSPTSTRWPRA